MRHWPDTAKAALTRYLVDRAHPLVLSLDRERQVREVHGDGTHFGYPQGDFSELLELVGNLLIGADERQSSVWPLVDIGRGHHAAVLWIPDEPFDHLALTDADTCSAELTERQQAANELALAGIEKSRTIRELKKVRGELEARSQALADAQKFQKRLIDTLSHDIRTPLTSISGYAALLEPHLSGNTALHRALGAIQRNAVYLKSLAENLLQLASIGQADGLLLQRRPFVLEQLAADVDSVIRPMAQGKGLRLSVEASSSIERMPFFDDLKLQQILINLLSNAVRYTSGGKVEANLDFDGEQLQIKVSDTGIGIAPEYQKRVFEPLNRGAQQGCEGAGLGLSIVKQLVEQMSGSLELESVVGVGSRFCVTLPEAIADEGKPPTSTSTLGDEPPLTLQNNRVLIIDDDPDICELLLWSLRDIGYKPEILGDPASALERVAELKPGLLLIDVDLGVRSGLTVAQELRLQHYTGALVVFSGATDTRIRQAAEKAGADAFLAKPLDLRRLLAWMRGMLPAHSDS
ncbi:MAG TPA: ATP-binding protein [Xanthomonadales bacterium]|nr:ATP-binding protein [Xanthomonadales bacterium]